MTQRSEARYTWIITPAGTDYETANALAAEKARGLVSEGESIPMMGVLSFTGTPIPDQPGMERWEVHYTVITSEPPKVDKQGPVRKAIEAMTTWVVERDHRSLDALVAEHLVGPEAAHAFAVGMISLCGDTLLRAALAEGGSGQATDAEMLAVLQDIARRNELE